MASDRGNITREHVEQALEGKALSPPERQALRELLDAGGKKFFFNGGVERWEPEELTRGLQVWRKLQSTDVKNVHVPEFDVGVLLERLDQGGDAGFVMLHEAHAVLEDDALPAPERQVLELLLNEGAFKTGVLGWGDQYVQRKMNSLIDAPAKEAPP